MMSKTPSGFHTDVMAVVLQEPLLQFQYLIVEGGESLLLVVRRNTVRCDDGGDKKLFVDINSTADWVHYFQNTTLLQHDCLKKGRD